MTFLKLFFNRQRWWTTILAAFAVVVMISLGLWQVDRLQQRRAFNARTTAQLNEPPLALAGDALNNLDVKSMEYRTVVVTGQYDFAHEIGLRNQAFRDQVGINLLAPLVIAGTQQAILVNRGWIPFEDSAPARWSKFTEPGTVQVRGVIRLSQAKPDFGGISDPAGAHPVWNLVTVEKIQEQMPYPLLPVYIQQTPEGASVVTGETPFTVVNVPTSSTPVKITLPARSPAQIDLSEGSHAVYAIQWFTFAAIVGIGYPALVIQRAKKKPSLQENK